MDERSVHLGLDVQKDGISVAVATLGRTRPGVVGKTANDFSTLAKLLSRMRIGSAEQLHLVYEADRLDTACSMLWRRLGTPAR